MVASSSYESIGYSVVDLVAGALLLCRSDVLEHAAQDARQHAQPLLAEGRHTCVANATVEVS